MKKTLFKCNSCPYWGYSRDICNLHGMKKSANMFCDRKGGQWTHWWRKAAIGASVGITGMVAGLAVLPALGVHGLLGHLVAVKISGAGGIVGAGTNVAMNRGGKESDNRKRKKKLLLLPNHFGGNRYERKKRKL